jgi:hypothetical protein
MPIYRSTPLQTPYSKTIKRQFNTAVTIPTANSYLQLLNVTGSGYLYKAVIAGINAQVRKIRITVDGTVVFWANGNSSGASYTSAFGICMPWDLDIGGNGGQSNQLVVKIAQNYSGASTHGLYPNATEQTMQAGYNGLMTVLAQPIEFKSSLLVEATSNISESFPYEIAYAN